MSELKIFSMFDGVGGFPLGLKNADEDYFETMYSNQYEPTRKRQDAFEVGTYRFPATEHIAGDVAEIPNEKYAEMKSKGVNVIVGGFPCQDYSVAHTGARGIEGKKGVLFWEIVRAVRTIRPKYLILENVDRLLKSPAKQRGRDFAIMLKQFDELGYSVEWRIINAADYGEAQRRRRTFFAIYANETEHAKAIGNLHRNIFETSLFARAFPIEGKPVKDREEQYELKETLAEISEKFSGKFHNTGVMHNGKVLTIETEPIREKSRTLREIMTKDADEKYFLSEEKVSKFKYLRGAKKIRRINAEGHEYIYSEGAMSPYDSPDLPARTMLTSEGSVNRSSHLLKDGGRYRTLTPIECERLQDFPDDWTRFGKTANGEVREISDRMRMFFMGNALVTGIVTRIGRELRKIDME